VKQRLNPSPDTGTDLRRNALSAWLAGQLPGADFTLAPASADASFRRYFRVTLDGITRIAMDAPPDREDSRPFIHVAQLMRDAGVHVPEVLAADVAQGFMLLTDLGHTTYLKALTEDNADELFSDAIAALITWQQASRVNVLPPYDRALLQREMDLFPEWYVGRHLGLTLTDAQRESLASVNRLLADSALAQPAVYVHRDYMPRNLMLSTPNPGVLDFQDAVYGPITYDLASLFRDAYLSWPEARVIDWVARYWELAKRARLPVDADFGAFYQSLEWMGLQRHLKVLGIFARIHYRDGKPGYLEDTPRFLRYVREVCARYAALTPLLRLFDELEQRAPQIGYTF
jgi:aminoglycoside/choline kinase family phosphotransferase